MSKRILLIDGDQIAYICAAAAEERFIKVTHQPTGIIKTFKSRRAFKKAMEERKKTITEDYSIEDVQEAESTSFCLKVIKQKITNLVRDTAADEHYIYSQEEDNFRLKLPLPGIQYKGNRTNSIRPLLLPEAKEYLQRVHKSIKSYGHETDDSLIIRAYEELAKGNEPILANFDKDAYQAEGVRIYNFKQENPEVFLVPELGELQFIDPNTVKGSGIKFLCVQWLYGDSTDGFCPYDLTSARFGAKAVYNLIKDLDTPKACLEAVIKKYKEWYPEPFEYKAWDGEVIKADWKFLLDMYFKCCWMKRRMDDPSDPKELFDKYGVDYT